MSPLSSDYPFPPLYCTPILHFHPLRHCHHLLQSTPSRHCGRRRHFTPLQHCPPCIHCPRIHQCTPGLHCSRVTSIRLVTATRFVAAIRFYNAHLVSTVHGDANVLRHVTALRVSTAFIFSTEPRFASVLGESTVIRFVNALRVSTGFGLSTAPSLHFPLPTERTLQTFPSHSTYHIPNRNPCTRHMRLNQTNSSPVSSPTVPSPYPHSFTYPEQHYQFMLRIKMPSGELLAPSCLVIDAIVVPNTMLMGYGAARSGASLGGDIRSSFFAAFARKAIFCVDVNTFSNLHSLPLSFHLTRRFVHSLTAMSAYGTVSTISAPVLSSTTQPSLIRFEVEFAAYKERV